MQKDTFLTEYTSEAAIRKYTSTTAGYGISHLLERDYKQVYLEAIRLLPDASKCRGIRVLEFGCGGGMNLLHLVSVLSGNGIHVREGIGTDYSPVLIEAAKQEAREHLAGDLAQKVSFCLAGNEALLEDLSVALGTSKTELAGSFDFILGVNTIRYCHRANREMDCAKAIFDLLAAGGVCVVIDMNNRFPIFRSALRDRLHKHQKEYRLPSLEEYAAPFSKIGFELLRKEHFCWIPHSSGKFLCGVLRGLSPLLNSVAKSRSMRSLVVCRKPISGSAK